jgi:monovalent cation/hydrogen antiporter
MSEALLLIVVICSVVITSVASRKGVQAGLVIAVLAGAASFIPGISRLEVQPELILALVMPPLLYSAALNFSFFSFMRNLRPIVGLGLGLVLVTAAAVTGLTVLLLPGIGVAGALVLAATVSPPDTVTTVTHGHELGLTRKVIAILTGESLVNDATALTIFSIAVAAVAGTTTFIQDPVWLGVYGVGIGLLVGLALGSIASLLRSRLANATLETTVNLLVPFAAYLIAEQLHASGVLAVVFAGFSVSVATVYSDAQRATSTLFRTRLQERQLWPVIDTLLESFVFAYIGLQLRFVVEDLVSSGDGIGSTIVLGLLVLLVVIVVRVGYVFVTFTRTAISVKLFQARLDQDPAFRKALDAREARLQKQTERREKRQSQRRDPNDPRQRPPRQRERRDPVVLNWKERALVSWTGMRGIVTLAAAAAIPATTASGEPFPGREQIQFVAFIVAIGTLVIQGFTLPYLSRKLAIDTTEEDAAERADIAAATTAAVGATPEERRRAVAAAVIDRTITDAAARILINRIDLEQAAAEAE